MKSVKSVNIRQQIFAWEEMLHSWETFVLTTPIILQNIFYCSVKGDLLIPNNCLSKHWGQQVFLTFTYGIYSKNPK